MKANDATLTNAQNVYLKHFTKLLQTDNDVSLHRIKILNSEFAKKIVQTNKLVKY